MSSNIKRKSAAVMFTDIAGYTSLMANDEEKALSLLHSKRNIIKPLIEKYDGVYVKGTGDGTLSYFDSAYKASKCAKTFQESIYDDSNMNVRVGIHIGDIVFEDDDVFGDGVNVASRLESMAPVGGICVSNTVYDELRNKKEFDGIDLGLQSLKGVGRLVEVFGLKGPKLQDPDPERYQKNIVDAHSDDEVPSIAIIPFRNKGKKEDAFYAYGICTDLISDCSSAGLIRVSSLEEIEELGNIPFKEKGIKLKVRYVTSGALWKMDNMFQLSIELYDTKDSRVLWLDSWQENWDNITTIKKKISDGLLKALNVESDNLSESKEINPDAYKLYLEAHYIYEKGKISPERSIGLCQEALEIDNSLIDAEYLLSRIYFHMSEYTKWNEICDRLILKIDNESSIYARILMMNAHFYTGKRKFDQALEHSKKAQAIFHKVGDRKGIADSLGNQGWIYQCQSKIDKAINNFNEILNISEELEDSLGIILTLLDIGFIKHFREWNLGKTWEYYSKAYKIAKTLDSDFGIAMCLMCMGNMLVCEGKFKKADDYLARSILIFKKLQNKANTSIAQQCLGESFYAQGLYKDALSILNETSTITKKIDYRMFNWGIVAGISACKKKLGMNIDYDIVRNEIEETFKWSKLQYFDYYFKYIIFEDEEDIKSAYDDINRITGLLDSDAKIRFLDSSWCRMTLAAWEKAK